ncbi:MAG: hypothetical protein ACOCYW_09930 [Roseicyclus sp.]
MEQLIAEVEAYARAAGITPQKVLRDGIGAGWGQWDGWKAGASSPTMRVADRLRAWMAQHPPETYRQAKRGAA